MMHMLQQALQQKQRVSASRHEKHIWPGHQLLLFSSCCQHSIIAASSQLFLFTSYATYSCILLCILLMQRPSSLELQPPGVFQRALRSPLLGNSCQLQPTHKQTALLGRQLGKFCTAGLRVGLMAFATAFHRSSDSKSAMPVGIAAEGHVINASTWA